MSGARWLLHGASLTTSFGAEDSLGIPSRVLRGRARRWRRLSLLIAALLALGVVVLLFALGKRTPEPRYRLAPVARRTIASVVEATGHLDAAGRVDVPAPRPAQLARVLVREGDSVKQGDLLAELDASAANIDVDSSRAGVAAASGEVAEAKAALAAASDTLKRLERLQQRGLSADAEVETARANSDKARAALSAARAKQSVASGSLDAAKLSRGTLDLRAPKAGVVLRAPVVIGSIVRPEQGALFAIGDALTVMRIDARVAEADVGQVKRKQRVTFTVPAFPARTFEAEISELGVEGEREGGSVLYPLVLVAQNPEGLLLPGMSARLSIQVATAENVLSVRDAALRFTPEASAEPPPEPRVWLSRDGVKARSIDVSVGVSDGIYTEVRPRTAGAFGAGDTVVIGRVTAKAGEDGGPGISLRSR